MFSKTTKLKRNAFSSSNHDWLQEAKSHREKELKTAEEDVKKSKKKAEESTKNMKAKQQASLCVTFIHFMTEVADRSIQTDIKTFFSYFLVFTGS